jgi:hypothetical protein
MVALCNFLSKGKGREKINLDGLITLLPKFLRFLPGDKRRVLNDDETYLAGMCACELQLLTSDHRFFRSHFWNNLQPQLQQHYPPAMLRDGLFSGSSCFDFTE